MTKDQRRSRIELAHKGYMNAFVSAHPHDWYEKMPDISYENGWFCFRNKYVGSAGVAFIDQRAKRYRLKEVDEMTDRLIAMRPKVVIHK